MAKRQQTMASIASNQCDLMDMTREGHLVDVLRPFVVDDVITLIKDYAKQKKLLFLFTEEEAQGRMEGKQHIKKEKTDTRESSLVVDEDEEKEGDIEGGEGKEGDAAEEEEGEGEGDVEGDDGEEEDETDADNNIFVSSCTIALFDASLSKFSTYQLARPMPMEWDGINYLDRHFVTTIQTHDEDDDPDNAYDLTTLDLNTGQMTTEEYTVLHLDHLRSYPFPSRPSFKGLIHLTAFTEEGKTQIISYEATSHRFYRIDVLKQFESARMLIYTPQCNVLFVYNDETRQFWKVLNHKTLEIRHPPPFLLLHEHCHVVTEDFLYFCLRDSFVFTWYVYDITKDDWSQLPTNDGINPPHWHNHSNAVILDNHLFACYSRIGKPYVKLYSYDLQQPLQTGVWHQHEIAFPAGRFIDGMICI